MEVALEAELRKKQNNYGRPRWPQNRGPEMEAAAAPGVEAARNSSTARTARSSRLSLEHEEELIAILDATLRRFPHQVKDEWQLAVYARDMIAMTAECGLARVKTAIERSWTHCKFFPSPAEVRELMPEPDYFGLKPACDESCTACGGTGWEMVLVASTFLPGTMERRAKRCGQGKKWPQNAVGGGVAAQQEWAG